MYLLVASNYAIWTVQPNKHKISRGSRAREQWQLKWAVSMQSFDKYEWETYGSPSFQKTLWDVEQVSSWVFPRREVVPGIKVIAGEIRKIVMVARSPVKSQYSLVLLAPQQRNGLKITEKETG